MNAFDVYMLPRGLDEFHAQPEQILKLTIAAPSSAGVHTSEAVRAAEATHYVVEVFASGTSSPLVSRVMACARRRQDLEERRAWERGETRGMVDQIIGGRPLSGG